MPEKRYLIEEILKEKKHIEANRKSEDVIFLPYPSPVEISEDKNRREKLRKRSNIDFENCALIEIKQIPANLDLSALVLILEKIHGATFILEYQQRRMTNSHYGFILINKDLAEFITSFNQLIRPDMNGVWIPKNKKGIKILHDIVSSIFDPKNENLEYDVEYNYRATFPLSNILISENKTQRLRQIQRPKNLIEEMIKLKEASSDTTIFNHLALYSYPKSKELSFDKIKRQISSGEIIRSHLHTRIFLGQIPKSIDFSSIILTIEKIFGYEFVYKYYVDIPQKTNQTSYCGFVWVPNEFVESFLELNGKLRPDRNGIWTSKDEKGFRALKDIGEEIYKSRDLQSEFQLDYDYKSLFANRNIIIELPQKNYHYDLIPIVPTKGKYLISEIIKFKYEHLKDNLFFYQYPAYESIQNDYRQKLKVCKDFTFDIMIGQLPASINLVYLVHTIEKILSNEFIFSYSMGNNLLNTNTSKYGFITIPENMLSVVLSLHRCIRPDRNGVWVAINKTGLDVLNKITQEIQDDKDISQHYGITYCYHNEFAKGSISFEIANAQRNNTQSWLRY